MASKEKHLSSASATLKSFALSGFSINFHRFVTFFFSLGFVVALWSSYVEPHFFRGCIRVPHDSYVSMVRSSKTFGDKDESEADSKLQFSR